MERGSRRAKETIQSVAEKSKRASVCLVKSMLRKLTYKLKGKKSLKVYSAESTCAQLLTAQNQATSFTLPVTAPVITPVFN